MEFFLTRLTLPFFLFSDSCYSWFTAFSFSEQEHHHEHHLPRGIVFDHWCLFRGVQRGQKRLSGAHLSGVPGVGVCYSKIVLEIKAISRLDDSCRAQVHSYLKLTKYKLGLLVNFGAHGELEYERIVF
jgi:PD-(D/E)XK nuclease superfamily protein